MQWNKRNAHELFCLANYKFNECFAFNFWFSKSLSVFVCWACASEVAAFDSWWFRWRFCLQANGIKIERGLREWRNDSWENTCICGWVPQGQFILHMVCGTVTIPQRCHIASGGCECELAVVPLLLNHSVVSSPTYALDASIRSICMPIHVRSTNTLIGWICLLSPLAHLISEMRYRRWRSSIHCMVFNAFDSIFVNENHFSSLDLLV